MFVIPLDNEHRWFRFHHHSSHARILLSLCFVYWCEADLRRTHQTATQFLKLGLEQSLPASTSYARYFLGIVNCDRNELDGAEKLFISPETVKRHVYNICQKLNVSTRSDAAKKATALGII